MIGRQKSRSAQGRFKRDALPKRLQGYIYTTRQARRLGAALVHVFVEGLLRRAGAAAQAAPVAPTPGRARSATLTLPGPLACEDFTAISEPGFGDRWNTWPWSMQWWRGQLYVGTNRAFPCVEYFAIHSAIPFLQRYPPRFDPDITCPDSPYDLPLQAEIWRYMPARAAWERAYQSPADVAIPGQSGVSLARDIGFRDMAIFTEPDGTEALYASGVSARTIDNRVPPPRLLRSIDGVTFEAVPQEPGTVMGEIDAVGFRSLITYRERLYVTATNLFGDGMLLEAQDPAGGNDAFRQVSPNGMRVFAMALFQGLLYVGLRHSLRGYAVMKTDASGPPPYTFTPVISHGGFRKPFPSHGAISMCVFGNHLYVGTAGPAEIVRIDAENHWDLVVGKPRRTPDGMKTPLSGIGEGFGSPLNNTVWRMQEHNGWLYVSLGSDAGKLRSAPLLGPMVQPRVGFELYATADGIHYKTVTQTGFDATAGAARTLASTPLGLFVGALHDNLGATIYLGSRDHGAREQ